jgi:hypothetical protein
MDRDFFLNGKRGLLRFRRRRAVYFRQACACMGTHYMVGHSKRREERLKASNNIRANSLVGIHGPGENLVEFRKFFRPVRTNNRALD